MSKIESKYSKMPLQTISRKVSSSLIDAILLLVLGVILTLTLGFGMLKNNEGYLSNYNKCFDSIKEMYQIQDASKLHKLSDDSKVLNEADYFDDYIIKQIRLSYKTFESEFNDAGITLEITEDNYSTLENDELAYYFTCYKVEKNINLESFQNKEPLEYFKEEILFKNIDKEYYLDQQDKLPILKSEVAISLYKHYSEIEMNKDLYYEFQDAVIAIREIGLKDLKTYEVFNSHFINYEEAFKEMAKYHNITLLIAFTLSFAILIAIPNLVFKNGMSVGKLLTRTRIIHYEDNDIGIVRRLIISLLSYVAYISVIAVISLFTFGFENLAMPWFVLGAFEVSFLKMLLLGFAFMLVNFILMSVISEHRSLIDVITNTKQVDVTWFVEEKVGLNK